MTNPDPREGLDREHPGGLIEGGQADIPGVQDLGPADADEEAEAVDRLRSVEADLRAVGRITGDVVWTPGDGPLALGVELVPAEA